MSQTQAATEKSVNSIVLDTGAIIKNEPSVSTLLGKAESIFTVPAIISEIRDAATRSRVETTLKPFLNIGSPNPNSIKFVTDFARRTGDLAVLSKPDIQIIALTYELECERNGGDWRLRKTPGQKELNGPNPANKQSVEQSHEARVEEPPVPSTSERQSESPADTLDDQNPAAQEASNQSTDGVAALNSQLESTDLSESTQDQADAAKVDSAQNSGESQEGDNSDADGWITPSNLKKKQEQDSGVSKTQAEEQEKMEVAVLTTDFAMQNVIIQMNLNLLSPSMYRVKNVKTHVLRCHACFNVCKDMTKQFCPRCGQPSMKKVACSTNANGKFQVHLKKNYQHNTRGDRYSVPKPVHGSANGRRDGGGKGGWGNDLILAEDQKEYQSAVWQEKKSKERSLMDEDYLPGILTGDRGKSGGRPRVGAGRNVNSKKR